VTTQTDSFSAFGSPQAARPILAGLLAHPGHQFWQDELTLIAANIFPNLPASDDLTDIYLLALAAKRRGRFATFDAGLDASLVPGGEEALLKL
jgi:predicted nucleic acid-binding protein